MWRSAARRVARLGTAAGHPFQMRFRQNKLRDYAAFLTWLEPADAADAYEHAMQYLSMRSYALSPDTVCNIRRRDVTNLDSASEWLAEVIEAKHEARIIFGREEVCRTTGEFLVREWPNLFCPSRDDVIIVAENASWVMFYFHEDQIELGEKRQPVLE